MIPPLARPDVGASEVIITLGTAYIRHMDRASTRRIRKMTQDAVVRACDRAWAEGARPISMVDDLSMHAVGPWIDTFAKCLARSARSVGISVVGGEMAQMPDTYAPGYVGIVVTVVSIRVREHMT
jgi:phosphoribosylaminoimidazole (AIR) synthetase